MRWLRTNRVVIDHGRSLGILSLWSQQGPDEDIVWNYKWRVTPIIEVLKNFTIFATEFTVEQPAKDVVLSELQDLE